LRHATRAFAPARDIAAFGELRRLFRELRPDLVHTHNPKPGVYGRLAARATRVSAVVNTVHGLYALPEDRWAKRALVYSLERIAAACSDAELVQNPEDVETLARIGVARSKLHLLGNGIDLDRFDPEKVDDVRRADVRREMGVDADAVVCGVVGRLVWEKGYREVFDAAARLRTLAPAVRVVVVGPSDLDKHDGLREADLAEAREHGVVFLGLRSDMEAVYAAMDVYVLASYREGFPRSAMEAAAMGLPVVATDVRGCRQVVDDGQTGRLVPVRDAEAIAGAVAALAGDAGLRSTMGRAGLDKARREFDQRRVITLTLDVYTRLLDRAPATA
jgi:glycosyltransferase involved in cell wall biosynthesis